MATVTGYDIPIDTSSIRAAAGAGKWEREKFSQSMITFSVGDDRLVALLARFGTFSDFKIIKGRVTDVTIRLEDEARTPILDAHDFSVGFPKIFGSEFGGAFARADAIAGSTAGDRLFAFAGDDVINGRDGDDLIDGGKGADLMRGGAGDDRYIVGNLGDVVEEVADEGTDTVISSLRTYALPDYVENLKLANVAGAASGIGNALDNVLVGNKFANLLEGGDGGDLLHGGKAADRMIGGPGDDNYRVDHKGDVVVELAGEGADNVTSKISYTLPGDVENLVLVGKAKTGTGNELANELIGTAKANVLVGGAGDDMLIGGGAKDSLAGGEGADRFVWLTGKDGTDIIRDFSPGDGDILDFREIVTGFVPGISAADDYLTFAAGKKGTTVILDIDGSEGAAKFKAFAVLAGFEAGSTSVEALVAEDSILLA